jgi:hypothetical protein
MDASRKRSANFSADETEVLTSAVTKRQALLFGHLSGPLTMAAKATGWEEVAAAVSAASSCKRSASEVCCVRICKILIYVILLVLFQVDKSLFCSK